MTYPPQNPDDEPRSEPFRPVSYDLAPEFGTSPPAGNPGPYPGTDRPAPPVSGQPGYGAPVSGQPGYGAPASGQPGYGAPVSGQPGYGAAYPVSAQPSAYQQPAYQQPAYQQPAFAQPTFTPAPPPKKKGKGLKITLGVVGGVFLVCAVAACVFFYPYVKEGSAHVTAPPTLPGSLTKDTSDSSQSVADSAESSLRSDVPDVEDVATGVYTAEDAPEKIVVLVAATGTFLSPGSEVDSAFKGFNGSAGETSVGSATKYDAGSLGGTVKCADGTAGTGSTTQFSMCVWADHGSIGLVLFFGRSAAESAPLFVQIREAVQTRS